MCCYVVRDDIDPERLARVLAGEETEADAEAVRQWAAAHPAHARELELLESGMQPSGRKFARSWRVAEIWSAVERTMQPERPRSEHRDARFPRTWPWGVGSGIRDHGLRRLVAIAAWMVAALGVGLVMGHSLKPGPRSLIAAVREYTTVPAQRLSVTLRDGTQVTLAPASHLRVAPGYGDAERDLTLDGEAVFVVAHDARRPFRVHAGRAVATDVGTRFDVRAYDGDSVVRVVVAEGSVALGGNRPAVVAGELATVYAAGAVSAARRVNAPRLMGWATGRLAFEDAPLASVATELARWYGASVIVADATLRARDVSIALEPQSLESALQLVSAVVGARVQRRGETYVLTPNHP